MLKLARRAKGHLVTLIEIHVHLIRVKPGHKPVPTCKSWRQVIHRPATARQEITSCLEGEDVLTFGADKSPCSLTKSS